MRAYAREIAFTTVYSYLMGDENPQTFEDVIKVENLSEEDFEYIQNVLTKVKENKNELDEIAKTLSKSDNLEKLNKVDLALIYLSISEVSYLNTPVAVSVNEVVSIAKKYSSAKGPAYVNGILGEFFRRTNG
ncbi:MAG: transcription antitermination factor NusB [Clostridia bacterium]|nr:transcription antitermination factor NusB [Clostridia bacterium]